MDIEHPEARMRRGTPRFARGDKKREGSGRQKVAFGAIKGALRDLIAILFYL